jgi:F-type H+-transporting ATPase subunit alpha
LFSGGQLPAIDVTRSVSRIGGRAQHPRIKEEAARMKLDYLQFLELETFTRFGSRLDSAMEAKIRKGRILRQLLKQERRAPVSAEFQLAWMTAYNGDCLVSEDPEAIRQFLDRLGKLMDHCPLTLGATRIDWLAWLKARVCSEPAP